MARTTATDSFQAIELKGSLLPGSLLEQVARLQAPMQKEADYGLAKGERLRERIDAAWVHLKEIWEEFKDLRERAAQGVTDLLLVLSEQGAPAMAVAAFLLGFRQRLALLPQQLQVPRKPAQRALLLAGLLRIHRPASGSLLLVWGCPPERLARVQPGSVEPFPAGPTDRCCAAAVPPVPAAGYP